MSEQVTSSVESPIAAPAPALPATNDAAPSAAPVTEQAPVSSNPVTPAPESTFLGTEPEIKAPEVKSDDKPVDPTQVTEPAKEDAAQSDEPAPLPTYEAFVLPEDVKLDDSKLNEFTKDLGELQLKTKADVQVMQEFGQKLIDKYVAETKDTLKRVEDYYKHNWEKQKSDWKDAFEKDPEIGGNRKDTTVSAALEFIRTHGGTSEQQQELRQLFDNTGIGNHKALIGLFAKANIALREGRPLPATKPTPETNSKVAKRYGSTT